MEDAVYHNGLEFGVAGLDKLLALARPAMKDSDSCERLYDLTRSAVLRLLRCNRGQDEVDIWRQGISRISALARASESEYQFRTASRFETLGHLLADQHTWKENYSLSEILELPFVRSTVLFLSGKAPVSMEAYLKAMGITHTSVVSILAELRLLQWDEPVKGKIVIWLTRDGKLLAADLQSQAALQAEI